MKKITLIVLLAICFQCMTIAQSTSKDYRYTVHFSLDKDEIEPHAKSSLEKRLAEYYGKEMTSISIIGHTDIQGGDEYNTDLSKRHSQNVRDILVQNGFGNIPMTISYQGEQQPHSLGETEISHANNRRVEIWFYIQEKEIKTDKKWKEVRRTTTLPDYDNIIFPEKEIKKRVLSDYENFHETVDVETQFFNINSNKQNVIQGKKGTIIYFPKNSFCDCGTNEEIQGDAQLELKEYYSMGDFMRGGLSTMNNDKILQSGGTIHLIAKKDKKEICLKDRQEYQIFFPKNNMNEEVYPDMQLFSGNIQENGEVNWGVMARNSLVNKNVLNYLNKYPNGCGYNPSNDRRQIKWKFFKRVNKFIFSHREWKVYKQKLPSSRSLQFNSNLLDDSNFVANLCDQAQRDALASIKGNFMKKLDYLVSKGYKADELLYDYYFSNANQLKWVNIDRFVKRYKREKLIEKELPLVYKEKMKARIILKDSNIVLSAFNGKNGNYTFDTIPKGINAKLVIYDYSKNQPRIALLNFNTTIEIATEQIQFETLSIEEFKQKISSI